MKKQSLYNRLALLREGAGLSRKDLADRLDINVQTVGYLERQEYNPSLDLAFDIAAQFGLPVEQVFSREPFPTLADVLKQQNNPTL
jgi:DNA-binding XRE family transcriptional regulator